MADRRIVVQVIGDTRSVETGFKRAGASASAFNAQVGGISKSMKAGFAGAGIAIGAGAVTERLRQSVDAASDLNEQIARSGQIFQGSAGEIEAWSRTTASSLGISQRAALAAAGTFGGLFRTVGVGVGDASEMSRTLVKLAADMASFSNTTPDEALTALRSGLVGESEPLRRFNVLLSEARVQAVAMADTGKKTASSLTAQEKAFARYKIILQDTVTQQGDVERTSGSLANQQRQLAAQMDDLSTRIGGQLIPALTAAATAANALIDALNRDIVFGMDTGEIFGWVSGWKILNLLIREATGNTAALNAELSRLPGLMGPLGMGGPPGLQGPTGVGLAAADKSQRKRFDAFVKGLGLKLDKARLTEGLSDDLAAMDQLIGAIQKQIGKEGKTFDLVDQLTQARLARAAIVESQASQTASASAAASAAAEESARRAKAAAAAAREARQGRQFEALGLTGTGEERVPGTEALRRRLGTLRERIKGTVLDTAKTRSQLTRISNVLSGQFGKLGRDVRSAILGMFNDIAGALDEGKKKTADSATVTPFQRTGVEKVLQGLGLSPEEIKALRQRLSKGGIAFGGTAGGATGAGVPHGAGRGDVIVHGNLVVSGVRDVDQFVKEVQRRGGRSAGSRRGVTPGVNRGMA